MPRRTSFLDSEKVWDKWDKVKQLLGEETALNDLMGYVGGHEVRETFEYISRMHDLDYQAEEVGMEPPSFGPREKPGDMLEKMKPFFHHDMETLADELAKGIGTELLSKAVEDISRMHDIRLSFSQAGQDRKESMFRGQMKPHQEELQDLIEELREVSDAGPAYVQVTQAIPSHIWEDPYAAWWDDQADAVKEDIRRTIENHKRRAANYQGSTDLKQQLIRLGSRNPDLRNDIRPVLDEISSDSRRASAHRQRKAHIRAVDEKDLKEELIMTAENDGDAHRQGKDARMAVENAIPGFVKRFREMMEDIKDDAIQRVHDGWHRKASLHRDRRASKTVRDHEVERHGVQHHQQFRGVPSNRRFDDQATGAAFTEHEAMEEALDQLAARGWEVDSLPNRLDKMVHVEDKIREDFPDDPHIDPESSARDQSFYVTVYVKG